MKNEAIIATIERFNPNVYSWFKRPEKNKSDSFICNVQTIEQAKEVREFMKDALIDYGQDERIEFNKLKNHISVYSYPSKKTKKDNTRTATIQVANVHDIYVY